MMTYSLLIVDDQKHLVDSMEATIPWKENAIHNVFKAYNAFDALDIINQHAIDILITDISMPGMNGLELIEKVRNMKAATECVLLTGYTQFGYAKKAIELRALDYLVKPVKDRELLDCIRKITEKLDKDAGADEGTRAEHTLRLNLPFLRSNLLQEIAEDGVLSRKEIEEKLAMYHLPFRMDEPCRLLMMSLDFTFYQYSTADRGLFEYSIMNIAEEIVSEHASIWPARTTDHYLIYLIGQPMAERRGQADLEKQIKEIRTGVQDYLKGDVTIFLSSETVFPDEVSDSYRRGLLEIHKRRGKTENVFIMEDALPSDYEVLKELKPLYQKPILTELAESNRHEDIYSKLQCIFEALDKAGPYSQPHISEALFHILSFFIYLAHRNGIILEDIIGNYQSSRQINAFRSAQQLRDWSISVFSEIWEYIGGEKKEAIHDPIIHQIQQYIKENLAHDVTLQAIAGHVYLHPVYVSKIYKDTTGTNLSDYVFHARMDRARELLETSDLKIYEIAGLVGYKSVQHFIREFRKTYAITPKTYRRKI